MKGLARRVFGFFAGTVRRQLIWGVVLVHAVVRRAGEPVVFEAAPLVGLGALVLVFTLLGAAASSQGSCVKSAWSASAIPCTV